MGIRVQVGRRARDCRVDDGDVRFFARSGAEITAAYPELRGLGSTVPSGILDGEIVVLDDGRPTVVHHAG